MVVKGEFFKSWKRFVLKVLIVFSLIAIGENLYFKLDLTEDKRYTLTTETINLLENVDEEVEVKIYLEGEHLSAGFVKLRNSIGEILDEFSSYSDDNISYEFIDLYEIKSSKKRKKEIDRLKSIGIPALSFKEKNEQGSRTFEALPGVEVFYKGKSVAANLLITEDYNYDKNIQSSIENLEYQLSNAIRKLNRTTMKSVGFLQLHGEAGQYELDDLAQTLSEYYVTGPVTLTDMKGNYDLNALGLVDVLVIAGPKEQFNEIDLVILDQYIMKGGRVLFLLDGINISLDSLRHQQFSIAMPHKTGLEKLLFHYGVRLNHDVIQDQQCTKIPLGTQGSAGNAQLLPWVYFPMILPNDSLLMTKNLDPIKLEFASSIDTLQMEGLKHQLLLETSGQNRFVQAPTKIGKDQAVKAIQDQVFNQAKKAVAVQSSGKLSSYFSNRILPDFYRARKQFIPFTDSAKIGVISSGTFASNLMLPGGQTLPLGTDRYNKSLFYDNKRFLLNMINYLSDDEALIAVRSKKIDLRLLDKRKIKNDRSWIEITNIVLPPLLIIIIGLLAFWWRKRKFAKT